MMQLEGVSADQGSVSVLEGSLVPGLWYFDQPELHSGGSRCKSMYVQVLRLLHKPSGSSFLQFNFASAQRATLTGSSRHPQTPIRPQILGLVSGLMYIYMYVYIYICTFLCVRPGSRRPGAHYQCGYVLLVQSMSNIAWPYGA